jgi:hypothetical protein
MTNPTANKRAGRLYQTYIAQKLGGKSVGTIEGQDVEHPLYSIECKKRKAFIGQKFMEQCVRNCPRGKIPLVIVHVTNQRHEDDFVMMRLADFEERFKNI